MRKLLPYILFVSLFAYLIIVLTFVRTELGNVKCEGLRVAIRDTAANAFVDERDVLRLVKKGYGEIIGKNIISIDKDSIEHLLVRNSVIKSAQVYYSLDGYFHVEIRQRKPILRVMTTGEGFYVDEDGKVMPLSGKYTSRVVVATGNISKKFAREKLYPFVTVLKEDEFWDAYVEQIIVRDGELVLVPKVGNFRIVFGEWEDSEAFNTKMEKLRLFLKEGIAKKGWNAYKEVNLKFDNQVVCVKR